MTDQPTEAELIARGRFPLGPRWIVLHLLVLIAVPAFAVAGFWQLRRLDERRAYNRTISDALKSDVVEIDTMVGLGGTMRRRARASGRYDTKNEVVVLNRVLGGQAGKEVLTPLRLPSGSAVLVNRGWIPADAPPGSALPPRVRVKVEGILQPPQMKRPLTPDDPANGRLEVLRRIDPARVAKQVPYPVLGMYLLLQDQTPANPGTYPRTVPLPELTEGSHLAYAVQWFLFIPTMLVVYIALLRRQSRQTERRLTSPS